MQRWSRGADALAGPGHGTGRAVESSVACLLSYFRSYFDPAAPARLANHSTGLIARHLHELLSGWGPVDYCGHSERPQGLAGDLLVSHFWSFARVRADNRFRVGAAVYVLSDPVRARAELEQAAQERGVPMPDWDLPPPDFDHDATMEAADVILLVGNLFTLETFPARWRHKIHLVNYSVDPRVWERPIRCERRAEFVYAATTCGLRKGFLDVLDVWSGIAPKEATLHVVGRLDPPYDQLLAAANTGSIVAHGWIDSDSDEYLALLRSCRFAYVPTWVEGQMGTMLEAVHAGCVPVTTRACGLDDEVLAPAVIVQPRDPSGQRSAIDDVLSWSDAEFLARQAAVVAAAKRRHNWDVFAHQASEALRTALGHG